jgi:hypothetical protein
MLFLIIIALLINLINGSYLFSFLLCILNVLISNVLILFDSTWVRLVITCSTVIILVITLININILINILWT